MPAVGAVGIAAGQFAGERERGVSDADARRAREQPGHLRRQGAGLDPAAARLLGDRAVGVPAEHRRSCFGPAALETLPIDLSITMVLLLATVTCLAAILGTLVSSRVRTYNAAQQVAGILLIPVWAAMFAVAFRLDQWGSAGLIAAVGWHAAPGRGAADHRRADLAPRRGALAPLVKTCESGPWIGERADVGAASAIHIRVTSCGRPRSFSMNRRVASSAILAHSAAGVARVTRAAPLDAERQPGRQRSRGCRTAAPSPPPISRGREVAGRRESTPSSICVYGNNLAFCARVAELASCPARQKWNGSRQMAALSLPLSSIIGTPWAAYSGRSG